MEGPVRFKKPHPSWISPTIPLPSNDKEPLPNRLWNAPYSAPYKALSKRKEVPAVKSILKKQDAALYKAILGETQRQAWTLELIASENMVSEAVLEAQGSLLTNKYAEGYPGKRYYGGCEFVDIAESLAIERA